MMAVPEQKRSIAASAWRLMFDYSMAQLRAKARALGELGLTPGHMKALATLAPGEGRPMGWCAQEMACDASTATWLIDRLEERGLVVRQPSATDRRVKEVVLTREGEDMKLKLQQQYYSPPAELMALEEEQLNTLADILSRLPRPLSSPPVA